MSNSTASLTLATTKIFNEDKQVIACRKALTRAMDYAAETRAAVDTYEAPIFAAFKFYNDLDVRHGSPRRLLQGIGELYLSEDVASCDRFYAACSAAHKANGYDVLEDQCPALIAEYNVAKLENALLTWASTFFNFDFNGRSIALRDRALALFECRR